MAADGKGGGPGRGLWAWLKANFFPFHILLSYVFVVSGLIVCGLMALAYLFVWPFSPRLYRKIVIGLVYTHWCREYLSLCDSMHFVVSRGAQWSFNYKSLKFRIVKICKGSIAKKLVSKLSIVHIFFSLNF